MMYKQDFHFGGGGGGGGGGGSWPVLCSLEGKWIPT